MKSSHASKESFVKKFIFQSNYDVKIILIFSVSWRLLAIHLRRIQKEVNYIFAVKHYVEVEDIVYISHCHPHRSFFTLIQAIRLGTARPRKAVNAGIDVCPKNEGVGNTFILHLQSPQPIVYNIQCEIHKFCLLITFKLRYFDSTSSDNLYEGWVK
jgi:hypothetical protein